jgi:hypothetical protein
MMTSIEFSLLKFLHNEYHNEKDIAPLDAATRFSHQSHHSKSGSRLALQSLVKKGYLTMKYPNTAYRVSVYPHVFYKLQTDPVILTRIRANENND